MKSSHLHQPEKQLSGSALPHTGLPTTRPVQTGIRQDLTRGPVLHNDSVTEHLSVRISDSEILIFEGEREKKLFSIDNLSSLRPFQQLNLLALPSHGTHKCSSQTLAPTLCTLQVEKGYRECLIAAEECEAHLVHSPQQSQRKCGF